MSIPNVVAAVAINVGGGSTSTLVAAANNPNGLILLSGSVSSAIVVSGSPTTFMDATDVIQDSTGSPILACQIMLGSAANSSITAGNSQDLHGMVVPAGRGVNIVNGAGAPGWTHKCSATLIYIAL